MSRVDKINETHDLTEQNIQNVRNSGASNKFRREQVMSSDFEDGNGLDISLYFTGNIMQVAV